jgi:hypothetical protein
MQPINKNWTDADGNHAGGQSIGDNFTIVWQRGPLKESGRNGALLIEVLGACLDWMRIPSQSQTTAMGIGFTIVFGTRDIPESVRLKILWQVLEACLHQVVYFQVSPKFRCEENNTAIEQITATLEALPDIDAAMRHLAYGRSELIKRRVRRGREGILVTHLGEAGNDENT